MRTVDWIEQHKDDNDGRTRHFASVMSDGDGTIYSYGYHYPLLFTVKGQRFVNTAGYSNTTSKHIGWAWQAAGYGNALPVKVPRGVYRGITANELEDWLLDEHFELLRLMSAKRRQDTWVYQDLQRQLHDCKLALNAVKGVAA